MGFELKNKSYSSIRIFVAESVATAFLIVAIVGSGILGSYTSGGNIAIAVILNAFATGAALVIIITIYTPVSGAHLNPLVTLAFALTGVIRWNSVILLILAQFIGGVVGLATVHLMFELPIYSIAVVERNSVNLLVSEWVATFGLISVILGCLSARPSILPFAVGLYIASAVCFTSSSAFANPVVTIIRTLSETAPGIRPIDAPWFLVAQTFGAVCAIMLHMYLMGSYNKKSKP